jgi:hypothetical protein
MLDPFVSPLFTAIAPNGLDDRQPRGFPLEADAHLTLQADAYFTLRGSVDALSRCK